MTDTQHRSTKASPVDVEKHLKGIHFPAGKRELISHARDRNAPENVLSVLQRMPEREYGSAADVAKGMGQID